MKLVLGMSLLLVATAASPQDRWRYAGSSDEFGIFLDVATTSRTGDLVEVWVEHRYDSSKEFSLVSSLNRIDCARRTTTILSTVEYDTDRKVKRRQTSQGSQGPIVPGTVGELTWGAACPNEAQPLGIEQVQALGDRLRASDPNFDAKFSRFHETVTRIQESLPPLLWAPAIEFEWNQLK